MSEARIGEDTMQFGLLLESAQTQQRVVEHALACLKAHTRDIDGVVRDEIRRTLTEELQQVAAESDRAAAALRRLGTMARRRGVIWMVAVMALCMAPLTVLLWRSLPSASEVAALRLRRDELAAAVARLERQGGRVEWRLCGESRRLCVRVQRQPAYGEHGEFLVLSGY